MIFKHIQVFTSTTDIFYDQKIAFDNYNYLEKHLVGFDQYALVPKSSDDMSSVLTEVLIFNVEGIKFFSDDIKPNFKMLLKAIINGDVDRATFNFIINKNYFTENQTEILILTF